MVSVTSIVKKHHNYNMDKFETLQLEVQKLRSIIDFLVLNDRYYMQLDLEFGENVNIRVSGKTGTKIGTSASQKIAFHGKTAVIQASSINAPSTPSGSYSQAEAQSAVDAINSLRTVLSDKGFTS